MKDDETLTQSSEDTDGDGGIPGHVGSWVPLSSSGSGPSSPLKIGNCLILRKMLCVLLHLSAL